MLDQQMENESGVFGLALLRAGNEVRGVGVPHDVGTIAHIVAVTKLPDHSCLVLARGGQRFRIRRITSLRPVVMAEVEFLTDEALTPTDARLAAEARAQLKQLLDFVIQNLQAEGLEVELPEDPEIISWAVAAHVEASLELQQRLLESTSVAARLQLALPLLRREVSHYRVMAAARRRLEELGVPSDEKPFSRN